MGVLHEVLEIIFEVQRKMSIGKITKREIRFQFTKHVFFGTPPILKPHNFLIFYSF
jgi:hypothetical protein